MFSIRKLDIFNEVKLYIISSLNTFMESHNISSTPSIVSIHIRLTDASKSIPDKNYLQRAMFYFIKIFKDVLFVIVSDDIKECRKQLNQSMNFSNVIFSPFQGHTYHDLALISQCNGSILTSVSTFGWWGAYISGQKVVYPMSLSDNMNPEDFNATDFFPPTWKAL